MAQQLFTYVPTTRIFCYTRPPTQQQQIAWVNNDKIMINT